MASALNFTIFTKSTAHALRALTVALFPIAFIMLLVHGVSAHRVNPAIGIIPLFLSTLFAALLLANERKCGCQSSGLTGTPIHLFCEVVLGAGTLVCLILAWVSLDCAYRNEGRVMLGTYGTNFLIVDFAIHLYFVGKQLQESLAPGPAWPSSCPQCQNASFSVGFFNVGTKLRDGYAPLLDSEGAPRISVDEPREHLGDEAV